MNCGLKVSLLLPGEGAVFEGERFDGPRLPLQSSEAEDESGMGTGCTLIRRLPWYSHTEQRWSRRLAGIGH